MIYLKHHMIQLCDARSVEKPQISSEVWGFEIRFSENEAKTSMQYVTYTNLFSFAIVLISIVGLISSIYEHKKK